MHVFGQASEFGGVQIGLDVAAILDFKMAAFISEKCI